MDIVFDGPPDHVAPRFVEVEVGGAGVGVGEWIQRPDGYWVLRLSAEQLEKAARLTRLAPDPT
jgi:hypothetical protein